MADLTAPSPSASTPTPLEALQQRHRKEQRDLVSRITQKKKQASKKTRKGVNDECERLERELRERQEEETRELTGEGGDKEDEGVASEAEDAPDEEAVDVSIEGLSINGTACTPTAPSIVFGEAGAGAPGKKKNRAKERLARRKAEQDAAIAQAEQEARNAPNPRELERQRFEPLLNAKKLVLHEIRADGHCLYAAIADQLSTRDLSLQPRIPITLADGTAPYRTVRETAATWIEQHGGDFEAFMEDPLPEHVRKIRETGEWGGHLELLALARGYGVRICVLHSDGRVDRIEDTAGDAAGEEKEEVWLGYYRHSHGLGEHYNSLRRAE
ncbi:OTU-like cysteine protease [Stagonosporopsis vannaccii]|nr:OTU-like cysteine protease [Stagonosporopsis vannaccii]